MSAVILAGGSPAAQSLVQQINSPGCEPRFCLCTCHQHTSAGCCSFLGAQ